jgi:hypothetical protein
MKLVFAIDLNKAAQCYIKSFHTDLLLLFVVWQQTTNGVTTQLNVASSNGKYNGSTILNPALTIYNIVYTDSGSYLIQVSVLLLSIFFPWNFTHVSKNR